MKIPDISKYLIAFLLASPGVAGRSLVPSKKAFLPQRVQQQQQQQVATPRKVEPVIDPELVGKLLTGSCLIQGALLQLVPSQQLEFYGMQGRSDATHALCSDFGSEIVATGVLTYLTLIEKSSSNKAVGSAFLFLFLSTLVTLLADRQTAINANNGPIYARLVLFGIGSAATLLYNQDKKDSDAENIAKAVTYFRLAFGVFAVLYPNKVGDTWGLSIEDSPADRFMMRALGFSILWVSVMMTSLLHGIESPKSIGYGCVGVVAYFVCQKFITKEWEEVGMAVGKNYAWMVFFATMAASSLSLIGGKQ